eukprot:5079582-Pyramimonas_sp.AAC.1
MIWPGGFCSGHLDHLLGARQRGSAGRRPRAFHAAIAIGRQVFPARARKVGGLTPAGLQGAPHEGQAEFVELLSSVE